MKKVKISDIISGSLIDVEKTLKNPAVVMPKLEPIVIKSVPKKKDKLDAFNEIIDNDIFCSNMANMGMPLGHSAIEVYDGFVKIGMKFLSFEEFFQTVGLVLSKIPFRR